MTASEDRTQVNQCIGVSRGGRSTKIHAVVDALGNPIEIMLTAGNVHDVTVAEKLLGRICLKGSTVLADKAYFLLLASPPHSHVLPTAHRVEVCKVSSGKAVRTFPQPYTILKTGVFQG